MKALITLAFMLLVVCLLKGQTIDTISLKSTYFTTSSKKETYIQNRKVVTYSLGRYVRNGNSYELQEIVVPPNIYNAYQDSTNYYDSQLKRCRPCWQKNYSFNGQLLSEGLAYTDCMVGDFYFYYSTGKIYTASSYQKNETNDWKNLYDRNLCGQNGYERFYSTDGKLIKTQYYKDGKLINCTDE